MTSSTPYLIRALYEWMTDNSLTPHLLVDTGDVDVQFPKALIKDNKIVLNISPTAIANLIVGNVFIEFSARFSGVEKFISIPVSSVLAIYSREDGSGMTFEKDEGSPDSSSDSNKTEEKSASSFLRVVK